MIRGWNPGRAQKVLSSPNLQTGFRAHPASHSVGTGVLWRASSVQGENVTEVYNEWNCTVLQVCTLLAWRGATLPLASFKTLAVESYGKLSTNINGLHIAYILSKHNQLEIFCVVRVLLCFWILTIMFIYSSRQVRSVLCNMFHC